MLEAMTVTRRVIGGRVDAGFFVAVVKGDLPLLLLVDDGEG